MNLQSIVELLRAEVLSGHRQLDVPIQHVLGADLMSDVLTAVAEDTLLLTGLTNLQVVRTADMLDLRAIAFARGKRPGGEVVRLAEEMNIPLLVTSYTMFEACGILYRAGLKPR